jgi:enoyl-[acyl-carrier protein] reductase III
MTDTAGRVALVTGGTRGIGRAITLGLARAGYRVVAVYARNRAAASALAELALEEGLDILPVRADLTDTDHLSVLLHRLKEITSDLEVVIHSAASGVHRTVYELSAKQLAWTLETNVTAFHRLMHELLPLMGKGGRVLGITSSGASRTLPFYTAVGASKGALDALFRHYARELAPRGISVNLICPGFTVTEATAALPESDTRQSTALSETPTGSLTIPEDVASVVLFLCSSAAKQIVGQTIVIDGGHSLN